MDKLQRELIQTYFAKRNKVVESKPETREVYESRYMVSHPRDFDLNSISFSTSPWLDDLIRGAKTIAEMDFVADDPRIRYRSAEALMYFPELFKYVDLDRLTSSQITSMILDLPEIVKHLPKNKLDFIPGNEIDTILNHHPQLVFYFKLSRVSPWVMKNVMAEYPEFVDKYDMNKFDGYDIADIIGKNPDFLRYYKDFDKYPKYKDVIGSVIGRYPQSFITILKDPELVKNFDYTDINAYYIIQAIKADPSVIKYLDTSILTSSTIAEILAVHPDLITSLDIQKVDRWDIARLLMDRPELYKHFGLHQISSVDLPKLLMAHPELIKPLWDTRIERDGYDKFALLKSGDIQKLMIDHPEMNKYLQPYLNKLSKNG